MATYVYFEGFGEWSYADMDLPIEDSSYQSGYLMLSPYQSGYLMLSPEDERRYKHLGILSPRELVPCEENITGCLYQKLKRLEIIKEEDEDFLDVKDFTYWIDYEKKHSLVVVDLKDIQTADQHPAQTSSKESELSTTKALAIMAWLLSQKAPIFNIADRPNAKKINEAINALAIKAFPDDDQLSLSTFNKKISEAVKLFPLEELDGFNPKKK